MTRVGWSEDEDYPGQFSLWQGNVARSLAGRKGQAALRDLEAALLALPEKRLIGNRLVKGEDVCANGALVAFRRAAHGTTREAALAQMREETAPACDTCWHQKRAHGLTCSGCDDRLARWVADGPRWPSDSEPVQCPGYHEPTDGYDDEDGEGVTEAAAEAVGVPRLVAWAIVEQNDDLGSWRNETDEQRYDRVLSWVRRHLKANRGPRMTRRYMAGPRKSRTRRYAWRLLIGVLVVAVVVAWMSVDEAQLRAWAIEGVRR